MSGLSENIKTGNVLCEKDELTEGFLVLYIDNLLEEVHLARFDKKLIIPFDVIDRDFELIEEIV